MEAFETQPVFLQVGFEGHGILSLGVFSHEGQGLTVQGGLRDDNEQTLQEFLHRLEPRQPQGVVLIFHLGKFPDIFFQNPLPLRGGGSTAGLIPVEMIFLDEIIAELMQEARIILVDPAVHVPKDIGLPSGADSNPRMGLDRLRDEGLQECVLQTGQNSKGAESR